MLYKISIIPPEAPSLWGCTIFTHIVLRLQEINCLKQRLIRKKNKVKSLQMMVNGERLKKIIDFIIELVNFLYVPQH